MQGQDLVAAFAALGETIIDRNTGIAELRREAEAKIQETSQKNEELIQNLIRERDALTSERDALAKQVKALSADDEDLEPSNTVDVPGGDDEESPKSEEST